MFVSQLDGYGAQTGPCALPNASLDALPNSAISIAICWMCSTGPSTSFLSDHCFSLTVLLGFETFVALDLPWVFLVVNLSILRVFYCSFRQQLSRILTFSAVVGPSLYNGCL